MLSSEITGDRKNEQAKNISDLDRVFRHFKNQRTS